jgi:16S rRNA (uracil1498-N3)-methyltransferase
MSSLYFNEALESPVTGSPEIGSTVTLDGDEARHAVTVARTRVGERLAIGNGRGLIVHGSVTSLDPLAITVDEVERQPVLDPELWLVQALAKGDRDELAVQSATELGVSGVIPWAAERSVTKWDGAKIARGQARWEAIVREASKQSIRSWVPAVEALASTKSIAKAGALVLDPAASTPLASVTLPTSGRITIVVGPEGGISDHEFELFEAGGAVRVRLGGEILRTSTAGPAALAVLNARLGRWGSPIKPTD